jgi:hypothetical protein
VKTLLDKPAVAPKQLETAFFNGLLWFSILSLGRWTTLAWRRLALPNASSIFALFSPTTRWRFEEPPYPQFTPGLRGDEA